LKVICTEDGTVSSKREREGGEESTGLPSDLYGVGWITLECFETTRRKRRSMGEEGGAKGPGQAKFA
jgi:hypothetical protein